jgi:hypothetical protein
VAGVIAPPDLFRILFHAGALAVRESIFMHDGRLFFARERDHRARAALARDLAATANEPDKRRTLLAQAARHARAVPGSLNEALLIRR